MFNIWVSGACCAMIVVYAMQGEFILAGIAVALSLVNFILGMKQ